MYYRSYAPAPAAQHSEEREYTGTVRDVQLNQSMAVVLTDSKATLHPIECTYGACTYFIIIWRTALSAVRFSCTALHRRPYTSFVSLYLLVTPPSHSRPLLLSVLIDEQNVFVFTSSFPYYSGSKYDIHILIYLTPNHLLPSLLLFSHTCNSSLSLISHRLRCQLAPPHKKELESSPHARKVLSQE